MGSKMSFKKFILGIVAMSCIVFFLIYIKVSSSEIKNTTCIIYSVEDFEKIEFRDFEKIKVSATDNYQGDFLKNLLQGSNYRKSWSAKVEVPILYLDTLYGGAKILKEGGGKQTQSLRVQGKTGIVLTLRSVNKNPEALVPDYLKTLGLENIVLDGISGQHPYASVVVAKLQEALRIEHTNPKTVFLPKQKTLGKDYNDKYGNKLYHLEYENKGNYNWTSYKNVLRILDTGDYLKWKDSLSDSISIDKDLLIRIRLFDVVIGDWDRHENQWGWVVTKNDSTYKAMPFPVDRDNAFFNVGGLLNEVVTNKAITPHVQSFEDKVYYMDGLIYDFDVQFLKQSTEKDFVKQATFIQEHLTDSKILSAFKIWDKALYNEDAEDIIKKIKSRRNNLEIIAKEFKRSLDSKINLALANTN